MPTVNKRAKFDNDAELYRKAGSLLLQSEKFSAAVVRLNKALELGYRMDLAWILSLSQLRL